MSNDGMAHQRDTNIANHTADFYKHNTPQVVAPAAEPAGKAQPGQAFVQ